MERMCLMELERFNLNKKNVPEMINMLQKKKVQCVCCTEGVKREIEKCISLAKGLPSILPFFYDVIDPARFYDPSKDITRNGKPCMIACRFKLLDDQEYCVFKRALEKGHTVLGIIKIDY